MINLDPVTLTFGKNTYVPIPTELMKQVAPAMSLWHPGSTFEKAQTLRDMPSLAMSGQKDPKCLCSSSVSRVAPAEELCSLQKETPDPGSSSPSGNSVVNEALSLGKSSQLFITPRRSETFSGIFPSDSESLQRISRRGYRAITNWRGSLISLCVLGKKLRTYSHSSNKCYTPWCFRTQGWGWPQQWKEEFWIMQFI